MVLSFEESNIRIRVSRNICWSFILVAIISLLLNAFYDVKIIYTKVAIVAAIIFFLMFIYLKIKKNKYNYKFLYNKYIKQND